MSAFPHARYLKGAHEPSQFVQDIGREVAFAGRSNSGKSSAINAITQRHGLAKTSKTPGQTQLVNFFELAANQRLVDLPGYGFAQVPRPVREHWRGLMDRYFRERESLAALFLVTDVRRGLSEADEQMLAFARACGRGAHVLLTKADKLSRGEGLATLARVRREVGDGVSAQLFSATQKTGVDEARRMLRRYLTAKEPGDGVPSPGQTNPAWG
ncbi:MAG: YihA family ribosome biogenesis GTP-binding protein [Proteobacteria bacterium]|nr:YihA family ribosome biogenesis GTP-binding protein [Pseudomonadota bacterium]